MMQHDPQVDAPGITVIIPAKNAAHTLAAQLQALTEQVGAPPFEVLVCDNGSTDRTAAVAQRFSGALQLRVIDASAVPGASAARNAGAREARGTLLALADADDVAARHWLAGLLEVHVTRNDSIVTGWLDYLELNPIEVAAAYRIRSVEAPAAGSPAYSMAGGNALIPAHIWAELDGMREDLPYGSEDSDFGDRAKSAGYALITAPGAVMHCRLRGTPRGAFSQQRAWAHARARLASAGPDGHPSIVRSVKTLASQVPLLPRRMLSREGRLTAGHDLGIALGRLEGSMAGALRNWKSSRR